MLWHLWQVIISGELRHLNEFEVKDALDRPVKNLLLLRHFHHDITSTEDISPAATIYFRSSDFKLDTPAGEGWLTKFIFLWDPSKNGFSTHNNAIAMREKRDAKNGGVIGCICVFPN